MQGEAGADFDDIAGDIVGADSDGARRGSGKRTVCAAGPRGDRGIGSLRGRNGLSGAGRIPDDSRKKTSGDGGGGIVKAAMRVGLIVALVGTYVAAQEQHDVPGATPSSAGADEKLLTIQEAEAIGVRKNPQNNPRRIRALPAPG